MGFIKNAKVGKEILEKAKKKNLELMQDNADKIRDMVKGLDTKQLKLLKSKTGDIFKEAPSKIKGFIKKIVGGGILGGTFLGGREVGKEEMRAKGGYVKMKRGGAVKKRAKSSSKKSRGTGAAIKGTKFKGVF
mgnify:CR=1 FL=1